MSWPRCTDMWETTGRRCAVRQGVHPRENSLGEFNKSRASNISRQRILAVAGETDLAELVHTLEELATAAARAALRRPRGSFGSCSTPGEVFQR